MFLLYVDKGRIDAYVPDGSITWPYKTIQSALTQAASILLTNAADKPGVSIVISPNNYTENCSFIFPSPYGKLDIKSEGGRDSLKIQSLEITPAIGTDGSNYNWLNIYDITFENGTSTKSPLHFHSNGGIRSHIWGCKITTDNDVPLWTIGDSGSSGQLMIHAYNNCKLDRNGSSKTTPAILINGQSASITFDFQGRIECDGNAIPAVVQSFGNVQLDMQNASILSHAFRPCFECNNSTQLILTNCKLYPYSGTGIIHNGVYPGDTATIILDGCFFFLATYAPPLGLAIDALGAIVSVGAISWDGAIAVLGDITALMNVTPILFKRLQTSYTINYTPTTLTDWNVTPVNTQEALDELAARITALEP